MKQILMAVMILVTGFLFTGCDKKLMQENKKLKAQVDSLLANSHHCTECEGVFPNGETGENFIERVKLYRDKRWNLFNAAATGLLSSQNLPGNLFINNTFEDSRAVWFSLDRIKAFTCYIEKYASQFPSIDKDSMGIRFYYAVYPNDPVKYPERYGQHTIFMVPTIRENGNDIDIDLLNSYTNNSIIYLANSINNDTTKPLLILGGSIPANVTNPNAFIWNNGKLCPTNCPTPNTLDIID